jgi:D-galactarolactone cycloisomerase
MRITGVVPLPTTFLHTREPLSYCFVRIDTDAGTRGYGEACDSFGCTYAGVVAAAIRDALEPLLVGEDPSTVEFLVAKLRAWTRRRLGDQWVAMHAISAVEIALWDLAAKARDLPLGDLLGRVRDRVPVYASSVFLEEGDANWHRQVLEPLLARGVRAVKLRLGLDYQSDLATLTVLRSLLDDGIELMVDGNENYTLPTALAIAARLGDLGVAWFEEPLPQHHRGAIAELSRRSPVPIAYGEHLFGLHDFAHCLERGEASIVQPDAATAGGMGEARNIARLAHQHGARVVPHCAAGPVALAANLHVAASVPSIHLLEYPFPLRDAWDAFAAGAQLGPEALENGELPVPHGVGLGVELVDEEVLARHPYVPPGPKRGLPARSLGDR